jgi:uncharacterized integral membrane protein
MNKSIIVSLIAALLLVVFSVQNAKIITIHLWFWSFDGTQALVIFISVVLGIFLSYVMVFGSIRKKNKSIDEKDKEIKSLKELLKNSAQKAEDKSQTKE